jgi:Chaperone for flagella basal body P-ring formation
VLTQASSVFAACPNASASAEMSRYQIISDRWDPILHQHWISVIDCEHPERPLLSSLSTMPMKIDLRWTSTSDRKNNPTYSIPAPLVRAGENVKVLRREATLQIEIRGVAEQNAGLGKPVRVRLSKVGVDVKQVQKEIVGVVTGPKTVEMQP